MTDQTKGLLDDRGYWNSIEQCEVAERFEQLEAENAALRAEVAHWKGNHATEVRRARILKDRTDMPVERVSAYQQWGKDLENLAASQAREQQLREFSLDQWWYKELLLIAEESGVVQLSLDAKRAIIGVIPNLIRQIHSQPSDTSALEALIAKAGEVMRERCLNKVFMKQGAVFGMSLDDAIRELPIMTVDELK